MTITTKNLNPTTAQSMIAISAILNGASKYVTQPDAPGNWKCIYNKEKKTFGILNNTWQLWQNGSDNEYAIAFQGTQANAPSIIEDILFPMVHVEASANIAPQNVSLELPRTKGSGVHLGFLYGTIVMLSDILFKIRECITSSNATVYITGHSMGAAIATLTTNVLNQAATEWPDLLRDLLHLNNVSNWQSFVFAQPKPGDNNFANEMNYLFSNTGSFYRFVQKLDWVPQAPLTLELLSDLPEPNPTDFIKETLGNSIPESDSMKKMLVKNTEKVSNALKSYLEKEFAQNIARQLKAIKPEVDVNASNNVQTWIESFNKPISASIKLIKTLDFASSGTPITFQGISPELNPSDPKDFMWQHHAAHYYWLLSSYYQLPTKPPQQ